MAKKNPIPDLGETPKTASRPAMEIISSDVGVKAAKPKLNGERREFRIKGAPGLRLRVWARADGSFARSFSFIYDSKASGEQRKRRHAIGEYPAVSFADAKKAAAKLHSDIAYGRDPSAEKQEAAAAPAFQQIAEDWLKKHAMRNKRSWREDKRMLDHDILPILGGMKAHLITKRNVIKAQEAVADRGSVIQSNRVLTLISTICNWALKRGEIEKNPARDIPKLGTEKERTRNLEPEELRRMWFGLNTAKASEGVKIALRLLLLCGRRVNELAAARKNEFDFEQMLWTTPGTRIMPGERKDTGMKRKEEHMIPITETMAVLLKRAFALEPDSPWVFPGRWDKNVPISEDAVSKAWGRIRGAWGLDDVTVHDLRRTFTTIAGDCEADDFEIDLVTDHKDGRSAQSSRYNQAKYINKKRAVLEAVDAEIAGITEDGEPDNVAPTVENAWPQITKGVLQTHLETLPASRIATLYNVSEAAVRKRMTKWGIESRRKARRRARAA
jgi:integrase